MRKIESKMIAAIIKKKNWQSDNTSVEIEGNSIVVKLHTNRIAIIENNTIQVYSCGYRTKTTKSRLNSILHHFGLNGIFQKDFVWYAGKEQFFDGMVIKF